MAHRDSPSNPMKFKSPQIKPPATQLNQLLNQGINLHQQGHLNEAKAIYLEILSIQPNHFDALQLNGAIAAQTQNFEKAVKFLSKAIEVNLHHSPTYLNLGLAYQELKQFEAAIASYDKAISLNASFAEAYNNLGNSLRELKQFEAAIVNFDRAISLNADDYEAYSNRGNAFYELGQFESALASYDEAIKINPNFADAYNNLGILQKELKQYESALASYDKAVSYNPNSAVLFSNRGNVFKELKKFDSAIASYNQAISIDSAFAETYWNKSLLLILLGNYLDGWALYEWRWQASVQKDFLRPFKRPLWLGETCIKDKIMLIHAEQGLGDSIQFCRYIAMVESLEPKQILVEVPKALISLLSGLNIKCTLIENGNSIPEFDMHCPMMSLPHAFKTTVATIPADIPYLFAEESKAKQWQNKLGLKTKLRVGLVWSGSTTHKNDHNRSLLLKQLAPILALPFEFHSLQKEIRPNDLEALNDLKQVHQHQDALKDFTDTAALIENMDLIISVDTSVAHLAGAMGKKVFILLPFAPDYRWMLDRSDTPWYPTATLFIQSRIDDWKSVMDQVKLALLDLQKTDFL